MHAVSPEHLRTPAQFLLKMGAMLAQWQLNFRNARPAATPGGRYRAGKKLSTPDPTAAGMLRFAAGQRWCSKAGYQMGALAYAALG